MTLTVLNTLAPLIVLVVLGVILRKSNFADNNFFSKCNSLVFHVALPCLLFKVISTGPKSIDKAANIFLIMLGGTIAAIVLGYILARILKVPSGSRGVFVQGSYRGNLAYVGLTIIMFSDFSDSLDTSAAVSLAALAFAPLIPIYNIVSVAVLLADNPAKDIPLKKRIFDMTIKICTNPLFLACVLGGMYSLTPLTVPVAVQRSLEAIGRIALPLAVMGIGATISGGGLGGDVLAASAASFLKLAASPLAGLAVGLLLGAQANELKIALIMLGSPTAVASFVMADQMRCNSKLASSIVVISTLFSAVTLAIILLFTAAN